MFVVAILPGFLLVRHVSSPTINNSITNQRSTFSQKLVHGVFLLRRLVYQLPKRVQCSMHNTRAWVIDVLGSSLFLGLLSVGVCTARYWTSGRLVQDRPWPCGYDTWLQSISLQVRVSAGSPRGLAWSLYKCAVLCRGDLGPSATEKSL